MRSDDQFEKRLERLAMKPLPLEWRGEILGGARGAGGPNKVDLSPVTSSSTNLLGTTIKRIFSNLFWPYPKAWAGLAAAWVLIVGLNLAMQDAESASVARQKTAPSPLMRELLQQQEQLLAELVGEKPEASPPKTIGPGPRSQRRDGLVAV